MMKFKFINDPKSYNPESAFIIHLSNITSEEQLFNELNNKFKFPEYFGFNWNAVNDCLRDLHWIEQKNIALVHDELPGIDPTILKIYLQTLLNIMQDWKDDEIHCFEVVFPLTAEKLVTKLIPLHSPYNTL